MQLCQREGTCLHKFAMVGLLCLPKCQPSSTKLNLLSSSQLPIKHFQHKYGKHRTRVDFVVCPMNVDSHSAWCWLKMHCIVIYDIYWAEIWNIARITKLPHVCQVAECDGTQNFFRYRYRYFFSGTKFLRYRYQYHPKRSKIPGTGMSHFGHRQNTPAYLFFFYEMFLLCFTFLINQHLWRFQNQSVSISIIVPLLSQCQNFL